MRISTMQTTATAGTPPSRWRPRWDLLVAGLCVMLGYGTLYAGPVYRAAAATASGWSQEAAAGAFALGFLAAIPVPFLAGWAVDRWGSRPVLASGAIVAALGLFGASASRALWHWYASTGITLLVGVTTLTTGASLLASTGQQRGSALGLIFGATGAGLALGPPLMWGLLEAWGWRVALVMQGSCLLLLAAAVVSLMPSPSQGLRSSSVAQKSRDRPTGPLRGMLLVGFFLGNGLIALFDESVYQHVYAYGRSLGLSGVTAAAILSATSTTYILGGVCGGALSDRLGRRPVLVAAALSSAVALLGLAQSSAATAWLWGGAFGLALGASTTVRSAAWADAFAGPRLGRNVGLVSPGYWMGAAIATYGGAAWLEAGGSFQALYTAAAIAAVLWAVLGSALTRPTPRTHPPAIPHTAAERPQHARLQGHRGVAAASPLPLVPCQPRRGPLAGVNGGSGNVRPQWPDARNP